MCWREWVLPGWKSLLLVRGTQARVAFLCLPHCQNLGIFLNQTSHRWSREAGEQGAIECQVSISFLWDVQQSHKSWCDPGAWQTMPGDSKCSQAEHWHPWLPRVRSHPCVLAATAKPPILWQEHIWQKGVTSRGGQAARLGCGPAGTGSSHPPLLAASPTGTGPSGTELQASILPPRAPGQFRLGHRAPWVARALLPALPAPCLTSTTLAKAKSPQLPTYSHPSGRAGGWGVPGEG